MSASSNPGGKGGYGGPNTRGPGGQGRDYNGNAIGSRMPGQYAVGGAPRPGIGFGPAPVPGAPPAPGDLYQPGIPSIPQPAIMPPGGRFAPRGMIPPAGARPGFGNPRQFNPGQGAMRPGQPPRFGPENPVIVTDPGFNVTPTMPGGKGGFQGPSTMEMPTQGPGYFDNDANAYITTAGNQAGY